MNEALQRKAAVLFELSEEEQGSLEAVQAILRETRAWNLLRSPAASAAEKEELLHTLPPLAGKPALEKFLRREIPVIAGRMASWRASPKFWRRPGASAT